MWGWGKPPLHQITTVRENQGYQLFETCSFDAPLSSSSFISESSSLSFSSEDMTEGMSLCCNLVCLPDEWKEKFLARIDTWSEESSDSKQTQIDRLRLLPRLGTTPRKNHAIRMAK